MNKSKELKTLETLEIMWRHRDYLIQDDKDTKETYRVKGWCDIISMLHSKDIINSAEESFIRKYMQKWSYKLYRDDHEYWWPQNDYRRINWMEDRVKELKLITEEERETAENKKDKEAEEKFHYVIEVLAKSGISPGDLCYIVNADFHELSYLLEKHGKSLIFLHKEMKLHKGCIDVDDYWGELYNLCEESVL